jgi:AraC-like DNA-binding protein
MKLFIKNMVSERCKLSVKDIIESIGLVYSSVKLGEIEVETQLSLEQIRRLKEELLAAGFELLRDKKIILVERIVTAIINRVHYDDNLPLTNYSEYISSELHYDYTHLANIFSSVKGTTIEHFIIMHKIERAKALLEYGELSLTEIAFKLHYSSTAHLSRQFKKITGLTATEFKKDKNIGRNNLEDL